MASRRYPTAELYEQRDRGPRRGREYEDIDIDITRRSGPDYGPRGSQPDFLREDYGRTSAGPLVLRGKDKPDFDRPPSRPREIRRESRDDIGIRDRSSRGGDRDDIVFRYDSREDRPRRGPRGDTEETDISIRREERSGPPPRAREFERDEINYRHEEFSRPRRAETVRDDVSFRRVSPPRRPPLREVERDELLIRREERERPRERDVDRDALVIRQRERSMPPPPLQRELVAREREEFTLRRDPPRRQREETEEIIIRRTERSPTPPPPPPEPEPEPPIIVRPAIHQDIITHHHHIDHGVIRARSPTPPPPPPSPPREESLEIEIRRRGGKFVDEDIIYERETRERKERDSQVDFKRRRSLSAPRRRQTTSDLDFEAEAEFYQRKTNERAYIGEAYNGATKDWAIVDVPPGTERVKMDGVGGASQEITWQRYNGVRRAKFITDDNVYDSGFGIGRTPSAPPPRKEKSSEMWTEITKDLVLKEAIEEMGYSYEETDYFFYVMEYLRYEDVLQLVEISDDIRRDRRSRIRQIQYERDELERRDRPRGGERVTEREIIYDSRRARYG
ncbi:hypothetical protein M501DRAFT_1005843 [Patellaria atrata CBS 101060]|uniref:DUF8035 domain-containing protein n=1 Tax=Patellaria atrata CBS 101060 TaxID=1346257 RepID=A0A9P4SKE9_9PEZI|nr:hypothetical protein M501DRAFT_1005843 [Patellaria atrata CBS 101060]